MGGETRNISSSGVLVCSETVLEPGETVEYYITLPSPAKNERLRLHCVGKVVRALEPAETEAECHQSVAMTMERYEFTRQRIVAATPLPRI